MEAGRRTGGRGREATRLTARRGGSAIWCRHGGQMDIEVGKVSDKGLAETMVAVEIMS